MGRQRLVVCGSDGTVAALDTRTGQAAWPARKGQSAKALAPAVAKDTVYLGGRSLTALALADGAVKWSHRSEAPGEQGAGGWIALDRSGGAEVGTVRARDGVGVWQHSAGQAGRLTAAGADNRVFLLRGGALSAMPVF